MDLEILRNKALANNVPIIKPQVEQILKRYLNEYKPVNVVEIWSAIGYSTLVIAKEVAKRGWIVTTFEVSYPSYMEALDNFHNFQQYNITAYNLDPCLIDLKKIFCKKKIDFLFIDAVMKLYLDFYLKFEDLLENNAVVLLDNVVKFKSKTLPLYEFLEKNQIKYKIFEVPPNDGVMVFWVWGRKRFRRGQKRRQDFRI